MGPQPSAKVNLKDKPLMIDIWEAYQADDWSLLKKTIAQPNNRKMLLRAEVEFLQVIKRKDASQHEPMVEMTVRLGRERDQDMCTARTSIARLVYGKDKEAFDAIWPPYTEEEKRVAKEEKAAGDIRGSLAVNKKEIGREDSDRINVE